MSFTFKALRWTNKNTPLKIKETTLPITKDNDGNISVGLNVILVRVKAAALNPIDILLKTAAIAGIFRAEKGFGLDYSGDIVAIGSSAAAKTTLHVGDRVCGFNQNPYGDGTVAEYILVNPFKRSGASIRRIPGKLTYEQAAAYPSVAGTAESMFENCRTQNFHKVLVLGADTLVGYYAVQLANQVYESKHIVVTCLGKTESLARDLGATEVIDYTRSKTLLEPVLESVERTDKFNAILDCAGNSDLFGHMDAILCNKEENGSYITVAGDDKIDYSVNPWGFLLYGHKLFLSCPSMVWCLLHLRIRDLHIHRQMALRNFRSQWGFLPYYYNYIIVDGSKEWPDRLITFFEEENIEIFIDSVYTFENYDEAVAKLQSNMATWKVVITM